MSTEYLPAPGSPLSDLDTPALVVDLDAAESNIQTLQAWGDRQGVGIRPHAKTHKSPAFGHKQMEAGAIGICCAKVGEAEAMVAGGLKEILIANEVIGEFKIRRLASLAAQARVVTAVETEENAQELSRVAREMGVEIGVIVEVNTGMNRCGTAPGEATLRLAQRLVELPGLRFEGLMGYEGHCVAERDYETRKTEASKAAGMLVETAQLLRGSGLPVNIVSAGGTGTYNITGKISGITDLQCGSYIFMDGDYLEVFQDFSPALSVLATVISRNGDRGVVDAGKKSISEDRGLPYVIEPEGAEVLGLSEEHVRLQVSGPAASLKVGDKVRLRPMHGDTTINLHSHYFGARNGILESVIEIAGRGRFR